MPPSCSFGSHDRPCRRRGGRGGAPRRPGGWLRWAAAAAVGLSVGAFAFLGEMSEGGPPSPVQAAAVAAVFMGLATAGVLIAYAALGKPLGLGER